MKQCKCGSFAFNLAQEGVDQGDLCDRHYWQDRAEKAEASVALLRAGDTCACQCEGTAYRIEARSLQARIEALVGAFKIEREGLVGEREAAQEDAARYRWLRDQNWNDAELCVVRRPMQAVKLGYDCPSMGRLDEAIDDQLSTVAEVTP